MGVTISGYLQKNSDNAVEFLEATDIVNSSYVNAATMQVSLYTQADVLVATVSGNYVIDSDGHYVAVIQDSIDWTLDTIYKLVLEIDGGANRKLTQARYFELAD